MNTFRLMLQLTRVLWSTKKAVIMDSGFCFLKGLLKIRSRGVYVVALIKIGAIGLRLFIDMELMITSGQIYWLYLMYKW